MKRSKKKKDLATTSEKSLESPSVVAPEEEVSWTRVAVYEAILLVLLIVWAILLPTLRTLPYGAVLSGVCGLVALAMSRFVYPQNPSRAHELAIANGLAAIVFVRPWVDGITFPQYNVYFFWAAALLFMGSIGKVLIYDGVFFHRRFWVLPSIFLVVTGVGLLWTIQFDNSYRYWINWLGYTFLFLTVITSCRSRVSLGIVVAALLCVGVAESIYAAWNIKYQIPQIRAVVERSPEILAQQVGNAANRPELLHRLYSNRAFGTFLFANALAAFLILVIPTSAGVLVSRVTRLRKVKKTGTQDESSRRVSKEVRQQRGFVLGIVTGDAAAAAVFAWLVALLITFGLVFLFGLQLFAQNSPPSRGTLLALSSVFIPIAIAVLTWWTVKKKGLPLFWLYAQVAMACSALFVCSYALILTVSRGGMLALALSTFITVFILFASRMRGWRHAKSDSNVVTMLAALLICLGMSAFFASGVLNPVFANETMSEPQNTASASATQAASVQGRPISPAELMSPLTFALRVGYWEVGLRILKDYWFRGIGLGNFGVIYPRYQFLGAGDVKQAHNDYLQIFCETGILGVLVFCAFWGSILFYGVRVLQRTKDAGNKLFAAGLFGGVFAFLLHSLVDFNFYNPSLATFQYLMAGLLVAWGGLCKEGNRLPEPSPRYLARAIGVLSVLIAAVFSVGTMGLRAVDQVLADPPTINARLSTAEFLLKNCKPDSPVPSQPLRIPYRFVKALVGSDNVAMSFGKVVGPPQNLAGILSKGDGKAARTGFEEFVVTDREKAYVAARNAVAQWLERAKRVDEAYPHSPDLAAHIFQWYDLLTAQQKPMTDERRRLLDKCLFWTREIVRRSPMQAVNYELLGRILWLRAGAEESPRRPELFREAVDAYRRSAELYPTSREIWTRYGQRLVQYGKALQESSNADMRAEASKYIEEGEKALQYAETLPARE
ncbi:MAG TPA: O-antigen ligase family protein [Candidatus Hydrogenedentes bacterium]|nr:O-antigen ligase family protein [Candidatus Hydrogenedentota bacterium]HOL77152.1 O-antigen ligase family protein [Candidatus Hydrogenedentota bacterium]HPO85909.1 O-antigen ligase family protein [Candidatus Hydrogenedentota bacterium]